MRLSEVLRQDDFQKLNIVIIGILKTDYGIYAVLGRAGQKLMAIEPGGYPTHPVAITEADPDPEVSKAEELSIRRRLGVRLPPLASTF